MLLLGKLFAVKTVVAKIVAPIIQAKVEVVTKVVEAVVQKVETIADKIKDLFGHKHDHDHGHGHGKDDDCDDRGDDLTSVPKNTSEAVVVYDESGDDEPDTYVRLGANEVEDPDDLDSYVAAADARLAEQGINADLKKVIFEDRDGQVTKVLYRTEDGGWSDTDPRTEAQDLIQPLSDQELAELDLGDEAQDEDDSEDLREAA